MTMRWTKAEPPSRIKSGLFHVDVLLAVVRLTVHVKVRSRGSAVILPTFDFGSSMMTMLTPINKLY